MNDLKPNLLPIAALLLTGITAFFAESHMPYKISFAVYRYPAAIVVIYAFFRFVVFADKRRIAQLHEVGLFKPLRDGAFLVCIHAHLLELASGLGWLFPKTNMLFGVLAWLLFLIGLYAPQQSDGIPSRLAHLIPGTQTEVGNAFFCRGLKRSGVLGIIGTFTPFLPIIWVILPLGVTILLTQRKFGRRA